MVIAVTEYKVQQVHILIIIWEVLFAKTSEFLAVVVIGALD